MKDIVLTILYTFLFLWLIKKNAFFRIKQVPFLLLASLFVIKILSGIFLILVYTYYYTDASTSDVYKYFNDGNILFSAIKDNPADYFRMLTGIGGDSPHLTKYYDSMGFWIKPFDYNLYNDNKTVIRFNALVRVFSFGSIYVHNVFVNFISFAGLTAILKVFNRELKDYKYLVIISIFLLPTVLFWGSGLLKEGILLFAFGYFFYYSVKISSHFSIRNSIMLTLAIFLLSILKFYVLIAAIPGFFAYLFLRKTSSKNMVLKFFASHVIFLIIAINFHFIAPNYNLLEILSRKQHDFELMLADSNYGGSYFNIPALEPKTTSLLKNSPIAFWNTLSRPYITQVHSPVVLMAAIENIIVMLCIILSLVFVKTSSFKNPLLLYIMSFVIIEFVLCGLTTPNMGALVRYKMPALPFLFISLIYIADIPKIKSTINKIKIKLS